MKVIVISKTGFEVKYYKDVLNIQYNPVRNVYAIQIGGDIFEVEGDKYNISLLF